MKRWHEIEHLPEDHPDKVEFYWQLGQEDKAWDEFHKEEYNPLDDESSSQHFNRYIAGDR
jgi:hypothetical protein